MSEMHTKNPWEDLTGAKRNGLRSKSQLSLIECIEFHKLTFFSVDAAERLKYYLMCSVKKPMKWTIRMHVTRMETLNKYLGILPTIKNSPLAVASTEFGNVPFTEATHASIILSHLPVAWRNQYDLTHKTVPESPRAMLLDLENIEKLFIERYNEKARANKAKAASLSVELLVFNFCFVETEMGNPLPSVNPPPVCPCILTRCQTLTRKINCRYNSNI
jgi:hypothetical protein